MLLNKPVKLPKGGTELYRKSFHFSLYCLAAFEIIMRYVESWFYLQTRRERHFKSKQTYITTNKVYYLLKLIKWIIDYLLQTAFLWWARKSQSCAYFPLNKPSNINNIFPTGEAGQHWTLIIISWTQVPSHSGSELFLERKQDLYQ